MTGIADFEPELWRRRCVSAVVRRSVKGADLFAHGREGKLHYPLLPVKSASVDYKWNVEASDIGIDAVDGLLRRESALGGIKDNGGVVCGHQDAQASALIFRFFPVVGQSRKHCRHLWRGASQRQANVAGPPADVVAVDRGSRKGEANGVV